MTHTVRKWVRLEHPRLGTRIVHIEFNEFVVQLIDTLRRIIQGLFRSLAEIALTAFL